MYMAGRGDHEELVVITKTYDLILWSCNHTGKFPRNHRFVLGERIERKLYDLLETLIRAKYTRQRQPLLEQANLLLEILRFQMRLAKDTINVHLPTCSLCPDRNYGSACRGNQLRSSPSHRRRHRSIRPSPARSRDGMQARRQLSGPARPSGHDPRKPAAANCSLLIPWRLQPVLHGLDGQPHQVRHADNRHTLVPQIVGPASESPQRRRQVFPCPGRLPSWNVPTPSQQGI
jgi:hypothetical protein